MCVVSLPAASAPILFSFSGAALADGEVNRYDVPIGTPITGWVSFDPARYDNLATTDGSSVVFAGSLQRFDSYNTDFLSSFSSGISVGNESILSGSPPYSASLRLTDSDTGDGVLLRLSFSHPYTGRGPAERPQYELTLDLSGGPEIFAGTNGLSGSIEDAISAIELLDLDDFSVSSGLYVS